MYTIFLQKKKKERKEELKRNKRAKIVTISDNINVCRDGAGFEIRGAGNYNK